MIADINASVKALIATGVPVFLVDTCALLDIIRVPLRQSQKMSHLEGAIDILQKMASSSLSVVVTTTIEREYSDHINQICVELERYVAKLIADNERLINSIESVNLAYEFNIIRMNTIKLSDALKTIADGILKDSIILDRDDECIGKAHTRVERYSAPSQRGKSEAKDCVIVEHFLKFSHELRDSGFSGKMVFITSNSRDYGTAPKFRSPLDQDFQKVNVLYANTFKWALSLLI